MLQTLGTKGAPLAVPGGMLTTVRVLFVRPKTFLEKFLPISGENHVSSLPGERERASRQLVG